MTPEQFTNGVPWHLCLFLAARKAEEQGKHSLALEMDNLSDQGSPAEDEETEKWLRKHKHCAACGRGLLHGGPKKPELEYNITPKGFDVRVICGVCADAKRALLVFWELTKYQENGGTLATGDLKHILPPEEYAAVDRFLKRKRFCDECGAPLGEECHHMTAIDGQGFTCYSICVGCNALWEREAKLPNILARLMEGER